MTGLSADDFAVYEDGVQQDVSFFAARNVPLDLALLLDTSASMTDKMQTMQEAAAGFAATLRPGDRVSIVDIKDTVKILHALDDDPGGADAAIRGTMARGGTALYNGLYMTLKEMVKQRRQNGDVRRQAIAVLSDGQDTASLIAFDDVMDVAKQTGIAIYTITLKSPSGERSGAQRQPLFLAVGVRHEVARAGDRRTRVLPRLHRGAGGCVRDDRGGAGVAVRARLHVEEPEA